MLIIMVINLIFKLTTQLTTHNWSIIIKSVLYVLAVSVIRGFIKMQWWTDPSLKYLLMVLQSPIKSRFTSASFFRPQSSRFHQILHCVLQLSSDLLSLIWRYFNQVPDQKNLCYVKLPFIYYLIIVLYPFMVIQNILETSDPHRKVPTYNSHRKESPCCFSCCHGFKSNAAHPPTHLYTLGTVWMAGLYPQAIVWNWKKPVSSSWPFILSEHTKYDDSLQQAVFLKITFNMCKHWGWLMCLRPQQNKVCVLKLQLCFLDWSVLSVKAKSVSLVANPAGSW